MRNLLGPGVLALAAGVACQAPTPSRAQSETEPETAPTPAGTPSSAIEGPADFVRDVAVSEREANAVAKQIGGPMCEALMREDSALATKLLRPSFRAELFERAVDGPGFVAALLELRSEFALAERCKLKPLGFELAPDHDWARVDFKVVLAGRDAEQRARLDRGHMLARVEREPGGEWRLARAELAPLESRVSEHDGFVDATAVVGASLDRGPEVERLRRELIDRRALLTFGGLAVRDFDRDGFDDLLVTIAGEGVWMLHNDGRGAFERGESLVPAAQAGVFSLALDLDGDGRDELLSTAVVGCEAGQAELGFWTREGSKWVASPEPLRFESPCRGYQTIRFEHIAVGDLDRDGHLDLLVSGYANSGSKGAHFNSYDARDGQRNLLFMGRGGLAFTELGQARGLAEHRYTYASAIHDFDGDGDLDLYSVNDYGPNTWLGNDGAGHFSPLEGPLGEAGNSMGVSVVDLDGDLDFDVYVSNMYSSAGNRLLPLVADQVDPATHRNLLAMAAGNSLYAREGQGWREVAGDLGLRKAGWAWGHTVADLDNDGQREVYVVNGLTSHSDAKAPDF